MGGALPEIPTELVVCLRSARLVTVLTGAGISAESGVPTFRDAQTGLWARYRPEELATRDAFERNPRLVWEWYAWRRTLIGQAKPNPGHAALVEMERRLADFTLVTQNVDGLHRQAGSVKVIELHGNIWRAKCFREDRLVESWREDGEGPPRCAECGGMLRPDVVWFGENLPPAALEQAWEAALNCDLFISVGTSGIVYPAAALPALANQRGAPIVEINPEETPLTRYAAYALQGPAGVVLPELVKATWGQV
jgi:NAD-dependent deacetylase